MFNAISAAVNAGFAYLLWESDPHVAGFGAGVALWCLVDFMKGLSK